MRKKYELIPLKPDHPYYKIGARYQIRSLIDFWDVKAGDLGGYVTGEHNLDQEGTCWSYEEAAAVDKSRVRDHAKMHDESVLYGVSQICNDVNVYDRASLHHHAKMFGCSKIYDDARLYNYASLHDYAVVKGRAEIWDKSVVSGHSVIADDAFLLEDVVCRDVEIHGTLFKGVVVESNDQVLEIRSGSEKITITQYDGEYYVARNKWRGVLSKDEVTQLLQPLLKIIN